MGGVVGILKVSRCGVGAALLGALPWDCPVLPDVLPLGHCACWGQKSQ